MIRRALVETIKCVLDDGAFAPTRAHEDDAGLDLYAREDAIIPAHGSAVFDTGVHIELPHLEVSNGMWTEVWKTVGFIKSKSGLYVKHDIVTNGTVDKGYTGSIVVKLHNHGGNDYQVKRGDKIAQLCIVPVLTPAVQIVRKLNDTSRGANGFGSTGR